MPGVPRVEVAPDAILVLVLPPIVYVAAFFTPIRSFRADLGNIVSLAIGLVLASTFAVASIAMAIVPGMTLPIAIALGAIVSPPDEVAAQAVVERLAVPRRLIVLLQGENLLNDATALTIYRVALVTAALGTPILSWAPVGRFVLVALGGIASGLAIGWLSAWVRSRITDTPVEITLSLLTSYAAYLPADMAGASGVLAAVTAGLYLGPRASGFTGSDLRLAIRPVWDMIVFLLNGIVFLLIGLQISAIVSGTSVSRLLVLVAQGLAVSLTLIVVRALWIYGIRTWQRLRHSEPISLPEVIVLSWTGMRGVVSLAAALAVPLALPSGSPVPARDALIVITFTVILVTLVGQGVSLPFVIRAVHLAGDRGAWAEEQHARRELANRALQQIDDLYVKWPGHRPLLDQLKATYQDRGEHAEHLDQPPGSVAEQELVEHRQIRRAVIDVQRAAVLEMRDRGTIDDDVRRSIERELDLEEVRMEA